MKFAFITDTDVQDVATILTSTYNLLLLMFYFKIINTGRELIIRIFKKGRKNKDGLS